MSQRIKPKSRSALPSVIVEAQKPGFTKPEELSDFVSELRTSLPDFDVRAGKVRLVIGGVAWWEVVRVHVAQVPDALIATTVRSVLEAGARWAKARFKVQKDNPYGRPVPKSLVVHNSEGKAIASVVYRSARHKPLSTQPLMDQTNNPTPKRTKKKGKKESG